MQIKTKLLLGSGLISSSFYDFRCGPFEQSLLFILTLHFLDIYNIVFNFT